MIQTGAPFGVSNYFDRLIRLTVENAATMPFYAARWPRGVAARVRAAKDILELPVISRMEVQESAGWGFGDPSEAALIHHTKGTGGRGLIYRFRTRDEIRFLSEFFMRAGAGRASTDVPDLFLLQEADSYHGTPIPIPLPTSGMVMHVSGDRKGVDHFADVMGRDLPVSREGRRVNAFSGTSSFLFLATLNLLLLGRNPGDQGMIALATSGGYLTRWRRRFLERHWQCPVINNFSLSEVFATAASGSARNSFVFHPTVLVEFLDPRTRSPVADGPAILVLTELMPFVTGQPLIRYWTGDLVLPLEPEAHHLLRPFMPLGRYERAIQLNDGTVVVPELALIEALEETPELAWTYHQPWIGEMFGRIPIDRPHARLRRDDGGNATRLVLEIQTSYSSLTNPEITARIAQDVRARVIAKAPWLQQALGCGRVSFAVDSLVSVPPGEIDY